MEKCNYKTIYTFEEEIEQVCKINHKLNKYTPNVLTLL